MALLAQWVRQRPWLAAGIAGAAGGIAGIAHGIAAMTSTASALAFGGISTKRQSSEHPFRTRVLRTLERHPGLCYRELQHELSAANEWQTVHESYALAFCWSGVEKKSSM